MRKIFCMSLATLITLTGCSSDDNELVTAIGKSYDLETGSIESKFNYTTEYGNIDIAGTVSGDINIEFGDDLDKISANVNFEDKQDKFEYYVDHKGNIISDDVDTDVMFAPLYINAPDLDPYIESIPEPKSITKSIDGVDKQFNMYTFSFEKLDTEVAKSLFDPVIKLGFVSTDILQGDIIDGTFKLTYVVDPETGLLYSEKVNFVSEEDDNLSTKTTININNMYNYDQTDVSLPEELSTSEQSEEGSEA